MLAIYYALVSGSYTLGMSVFAITSITQLLAEIPTGVLSDRLGRKPVAVLGAALSVVFAVLYAIGSSYWFLAAAAAIEGLARAVFSGNSEALVYETLAEDGLEDQFPDSIGKISAGEDAGLAISSVSGGVIAAVWSVQAAFLITIAPVTLALLISLLIREPERSAPRTQRGTLGPALRLFFTNPRLRLVLTGTALRESLGESAFQFRSLFFQTLWPLWALGIAQTFTFITSAVSFYVSGRVLGRVRNAAVLIVDVVFGRVLSLTALFLPSVASPALMSATSMTYGLSIVAAKSIQQAEFDDDHRATMGSINSQVENLGMAAGSVLLGVLADEIGVIETLIAAQALLTLAVLPYARLLRTEQTQI